MANLNDFHLNTGKAGWEIFNNAMKQIWEKNKPDEKESGFYDIPPQETCVHPEHDPPMHLYIPAGKGYRHVCPSCGKVVNINSSQPIY